MNLSLTVIALSSAGAAFLLVACSAASGTPYDSAPTAPAVEDPVASFDAASAVDAGEPLDPPAASPAATPLRKDGGSTQAAGLTACCGGQGSCVPESAVPAASSDKLNADSCPATYLCAPTEVIAGGADFVPDACEASGFGVKGAGVCLSECLNLGQSAAALKQGTCKDAHLCVPCKAFGKATGAPGCPAE